MPKNNYFCFLDHAWLEGDFLITFVEEIDSKWDLKENFDLVWADANVLRYFGRMEQKIIKVAQFIGLFFKF